MDLIHEIDYIMWFFGEVEKVNSNICKLSNLDIETEDYAEIFLEFKNDVAAEIHLDYLNRFPNRECEIVGEFGTISWDYNKGLLELLDAKNNIKREFELENFERDDMYLDMMRHFINCIEGKEEPLITIYDGKKH